MLPFKKILCTTDFSEPSYEGVKTANELAAQFSSELILVHVVSPVPVLGAPHHTTPVSFDIPAYQQTFIEQSRETLQKVADDLIRSDLKSETQVMVGYAADEIVRVAEEEKADLIVIATHGHSGFERLLLGSVTERVIRHSPCPVLSVKASWGEGGAS